MNDSRTGIIVDLLFSPLVAPLDSPTADEKSFFHRYDTIIEIDGARFEFHGGKEHFLACEPGAHQVRVYFLSAKAFGLFRPMGSTEIGNESIRVTLAPGETVKLAYEAGIGWRFGNASLHVVEGAEDGGS